MDAHELAGEIAFHLKGRDDIADADVSETEDVVLVRTQGGKLYQIIVEGGVRNNEAQIMTEEVDTNE